MWQSKIYIRIGQRAEPGIDGGRQQYTIRRQHGVRRCAGRELCSVHVCARGWRRRRRRGGNVAVEPTILNHFFPKTGMGRGGASRDHACGPF